MTLMWVVVVCMLQVMCVAACLKRAHDALVFKNSI